MKAKHETILTSLTFIISLISTIHSFYKVVDKLTLILLSLNTIVFFTLTCIKVYKYKKSRNLYT